MAQIKNTFLAILMLLLSNAAGQAAPFQGADGNNMNAFAAWLENLQQDAIANGVSPETARNALGAVMLDDRVVTYDRKQPETTVTFDAYSRRIVTASRINS